MPTQATSNQMFDRVIDFLEKRYPDLKVNVHLLHGDAIFNDKIKNEEEFLKKEFPIEIDSLDEANREIVENFKKRKDIIKIRNLTM